MPVVNEAENNPTECQTDRVACQAKHSGQKRSSIIELGIVSTDSHSAKGSSDQNKMVGKKNNWKGSQS